MSSANDQDATKQGRLCGLIDEIVPELRRFATDSNVNQELADNRVSKTMIASVAQYLYELGLTADCERLAKEYKGFLFALTDVGLCHAANEMSSEERAALELSFTLPAPEADAAKHAKALADLRLLAIGKASLLLKFLSELKPSLESQPHSDTDGFVFARDGDGFGIEALGERGRLSFGRKAAYSLLTAFLAYVTGEALATFFYLRGDLDPVSIWVLEETDSGSTIQFDPIIGKRLSKTPTRLACIATNGVVETIGRVLGNNHGFPDRDDLTPRKTDFNTRRFIVFGDSFTAAQYLQINWPDRCEDLAASAGRSVELPNLSVDGGGLVNWWRTLREFVRDDYQLDGVIFAIYGNDLQRPFAIWDDQVVRLAPDGTRMIAVGTVWREPFPRALEEARPFFFGMPRGQVHPTETFDRMLKGEARPRDGRTGLYFAQHVWRKTPSIQDLEGYVVRTARPGRKFISREIRDYLEARRLPALVVAVPTIECLLGGPDRNDDSRAFAQSIGAQFVDGARAFEGLTEADIRASWLPYDSHWGQPGSDRFAKFISEVLSGWPEA